MLIVLVIAGLLGGSLCATAALGSGLSLPLVFLLYSVGGSLSILMAGAGLFLRNEPDRDPDDPS